MVKVSTTWSIMATDSTTNEQVQNSITDKVIIIVNMIHASMMNGVDSHMSRSSYYHKIAQAEMNVGPR